jgi:precorrin-2 dehydrogenase/sirohydrochlorin ferrochelatase
MVPLVLDLSGRRVVIFGGGPVGARKAGFFAGETDLTVVSRSFVPEFESLRVRKVSKNLEEVSDRELTGILEGAFLAVAATDDAALNDRIGLLCKAEGIHFNSAKGTPGDVVLPAVTKGSDHAVAFTTYGKAPGMARFLRERFEREYPGLDPMIEMTDRLRTVLKERIPDQAMRREIIGRMLADREVWDAVNREGDRAWALVEGRYLRGR